MKNKKSVRENKESNLSLSDLELRTIYTYFNMSASKHVLDILLENSSLTATDVDVDMDVDVFSPARSQLACSPI